MDSDHLLIESISKSFGSTLVLDEVSMRVGRGRVVALLGPSGGGKTTLLRIVAGLEAGDSGSVVLDGRVLTEGGSRVPAHKRKVGMVFQDWALFPHLTVSGNVGYGLPKRERSEARVESALETVGLGGMGERMPGTLSGGQQQRVALARAVVARPEVLLLDEPFSNLDADLRVSVRAETQDVLSRVGITAIFVTHSQEEAFVMGDEVAVLHKGKVLQQADPSVLYSRPASAWLAGFVGEANFVEGFATDGLAQTRLGVVELAQPTAGECRVLIRPEDIALSTGTEGKVAQVEFYGHDTSYVVSLSGGDLKVRTLRGPQFGIGDLVDLSYVGGPTVVFPRERVPAA